MKTIKSLLLGVTLATVGLSPLPGAAQVKDTQVNALVSALKQAAPPNRPNDGMYSSWQVLPGIIPSWTKQCLGKEMTPQQFETDENAARQVVSCIVARELKTQYKTTNNETQAVTSVACWWMTGKTTGCNQGNTGTYVNRVVSLYKQQMKAKS
ncbi:hypothetical protein [Gloeothece verrucosa]|uniref:Transglycosylase SLT domain-containing protein n=1 Tax=Gloeothece verrucosa (strain PCC 7822) TaxID=497965 RepID=E0U640_GLOV7|nr:hypothetical protein [Gloeothece verrucosa]ADN17149.1 conserved hypothetical protein [Gloeothece verrucosa PCC 7822]